MQLQKAAEERLQREKLDEEFARSFQDYSAPSAMNPPANPTASAFSRLSGVPRQPSMTSSQSQAGQSPSRALPWSTPSSGSFGVVAAKSERRSMTSEAKNASTPSWPFGTVPVKSEPRFMTSDVKHEGSSGSQTGFGAYAFMQNNNASPFKTEPSPRPMPGTFRDDSSTQSDSDIEIIPPSAFYDNGRHTRTPAKNQNWGSSLNAYGTQQPKVEPPSFSPEAQTAGNAALGRMGQSASNDALQMAMYGNQQVPNWMNSAGPSSAPTLNPFGSGSQSLMTSATGSAGGYVYPSAYNGINNATGDMSAYGGSMQNGLGYALNTLPGTVSGFGMNQSGFPQSFGGSPQASSSDELGDIIRRAGNNYNEISDYLKLDGRMADQLDYIMNDPRKTNQEIKDLLENIRPDVELPPEDREGTPEGLVYPLVGLRLLQYL